MATLDIDLEGARHMGVAEAKATLSGLVSDAEHSGSVYVIERYGRPAAVLAPLPSKRQVTHHARGLLSAYADVGKRDLEKGVFARAMEEKHGGHTA